VVRKQCVIRKGVKEPSRKKQEDSQREKDSSGEKEQKKKRHDQREAKVLTWAGELLMSIQKKRLDRELRLQRDCGR